ncbi:uncharacterized protein [Rutidosis leptorrhynchoides]|uniref:uncharacterized protein n=1 Tax=Rutidosis leptorrhynchoides TaxID=125765 RepID=UPI003A99BD20
MLKIFKEYKMNHALREENMHADILSKLASGELVELSGPIYVERLLAPSIEQKKVAVIEGSYDWMTPIKCYLTDETIIEDSAQAQKLILQAVRFIIIDGALYKRVFTDQRCIKMLGTFFRKYDECQRHSSISRQPVEELSSILSPVPFVVWGINLLGPFTQARGTTKYKVAAIYYFTKWVEAKVLATIMTLEIRR